MLTIGKHQQPGDQFVALKILYFLLLLFALQESWGQYQVTLIVLQQQPFLPLQFLYIALCSSEFPLSLSRLSLRCMIMDDIPRLSLQLPLKETQFNPLIHGFSSQSLHKINLHVPDKLILPKLPKCLYHRQPELLIHNLYQPLYPVVIFVQQIKLFGPSIQFNIREEVCCVCVCPVRHILPEEVMLKDISSPSVSPGCVEEGSTPLPPLLLEESVKFSCLLHFSFGAVPQYCHKLVTLFVGPLDGVLLPLLVYCFLLAGYTSQCTKYLSQSLIEWNPRSFSLITLYTIVHPFLGTPVDLSSLGDLRLLFSLSRMLSLGSPHHKEVGSVVPITISQTSMYGLFYSRQISYISHFRNYFREVESSAQHRHPLQISIQHSSLFFDVSLPLLEDGSSQIHLSEVSFEGSHANNIKLGVPLLIISCKLCVGDRFSLHGCYLGVHLT